MKLHPLCVLACLFIPAFSGALRAQGLVADLEANYVSKMKITASFWAPDALQRDGSVNSLSRQFSFGVGNRDLLQFLIDTQRIAAPLRGWKIVARSDSSTADSLGYRLFAVKSGQADFALDDAQDEAAFSAQLGYTAPAYRVRNLQGAIISGGGKVSASYHLALRSGSDALDLFGIASFPFTFKPVTLDDRTEHVVIPGKVVLRGMGDGLASDPALGEFPVLVEGSVTISGHRITGVRAEAE